MNQTFKLLQDYFANKGLTPTTDLESKDELKKFFESQFKNDIKNKQSPLLCFHVLYHRLAVIADVAKETFYDKAIEELKGKLDEDSKSDKFHGASFQLRTSVAYSFIKSPKIQKLEKEIEEVHKKNEKVVKSYKKYQSSIKSIQGQIKAEEERLVELGMAKEEKRNETLSLSY